jgi:ATP-binding cassette subfamily B protein/ATP-binding cassette subfamily C protein
MPFISVASNPELVNDGYYKQVYDFFEFKEKSKFIITFGFVLISFYIFRSLLNIAYSYLLNRFIFGTYHNFAFKLFQGYIGLPYKKFINRNTAVLTKTILAETSYLTSLIQYSIMLLSDFFTVLFIYTVLLIANLKMTLIISLILGVKLIFLTKTLSRIIKVQGEKRAVLQEKFYRIISEAFGNFKIVKLIGNEKNILDSFAQASHGFARTNIINGTIASIPKNALETIGFSALVGTVIYVIFKYDNVAFVIPIISMYALALYRILPSINRIINSYNNILFIRKSLDIVHADLVYNNEDEGTENIDFTSVIELKNITFGYDGKDNVLHDINLSIQKGEKVAFVGESGSGKSTLIDIVIGIFKPCYGLLTVDGKKLTVNNIKSWRSKIGYIPQSIYLFDGTVGENVSFGKNTDEAKIVHVLQQANVWDFLESKNGIHTKVGEGGIQLSGGQKQRIGIARALYSDPEILVLDEATSALDNETESKIMEEIYNISQDKTLIIIAHRLSTTERCDRILDLNILNKGI